MARLKATQLRFYRQIMAEDTLLVAAATQKPITQLFLRLIGACFSPVEVAHWTFKRPSTHKQPAFHQILLIL